MFKSRKMTMVFLLIFLALCVSRFPFILAEVEGSNGNQGVFPPDSEPFGLKYSEWTTKWWQWAYSLPEDDNPVADDTGKNCANNQDGPVWFLAGSFGGKVTRECTVPGGVGILVPIINVACDSATEPDLDTEEELGECAKSDQDTVIEKELSVDRVEIANLDEYRFQSALFDLQFPENNIAGVEPQTAKAKSDGYWVLLEPLPPGEHEVHFKAALGDPSDVGSIFAVDVLYHLTVLETVQAEGADQPIMLEGSSTSGNFKVQINWTSNDIGKENTFAVKILDAEGNELSDATYSIMLFKGEEHLNETHREDQNVAEQKYTFDEEGSYTLRIENINGSGTQDGIEIPMQVTPEFPVGMFGLMATIFSVMIIVIRSKQYFRKT